MAWRRRAGRVIEARRLLHRRASMTRPALQKPFPMHRLTQTQWQRQQAYHCERLSPFANDRRDRMAAGIKHPVNDFLFEYYSFRPSELLRWSPGADVLLEEAKPGDLPWKEFESRDGGLILSAESFPDRRVKFLQWAIGYLDGIAERPALFNCLGLHEWAMVYRSPEVRHPTTPLRLSPEEVAQVVDSEGLRCTHFDAFRFFTPSATPLNRIQLTRQNTDEHDQKGCLHVAMDLYKYAYKLAPWSSGELIADAFLLACKVRQIDMRASPYDLQSFGLAPIRIETREGREEYVELQRELSRKAEPIRERLIGEYRGVLASKRVERVIEPNSRRSQKITGHHFLPGVLPPRGRQQMAHSDKITEFRIAPELRRCCFYMLIAVPVFISVLYYMNRVVLERPIDAFIVACIVFSVLACAMVVPLRWRLCLGTQGLKRRRLFRWDFWTWDDFASGRIQKLYQHTLLDPDRPWWRRRLDLGLLTREHIQIVYKTINDYYRLPKAPVPPDVLTIKYRFRHSAKFDSDGIHLRKRGLEKTYPWQEVKNVLIVRVDELRRDFASLQIVLPNDEIKLEYISQTNPSWRGAANEVINEFLYRQVPAEKIKVAIAGQEVPNREQIERELKELQETARRETRILVLTAGLFAPLTLGLLWWFTEELVGTLGMGAMLSFGMGAIFVIVRMSIRVQVKELKNQLDSLMNGNGQSGGEAAQ